MIGRVKMYSESRGFGFLEVEGHEDVFVHIRDAQKTVACDSLRVGERLQFDEEIDRRTGRSKAVNIRAA